MFFRKIKNSIPRLLRFLPISSEIVGPPKGYTTTWNYICETNLANKHANIYEEIYPRYSLNLKEPKTINHCIHRRFCTELLHELSPAFIAAIPGGRVWWDYAVITSDDRMLLDVSKSNANVAIELPKHNPITIKYKFPKIHCVSGTAAILSVAGGGTYAHWLLDLIPRFELLNRSSNLSLSDIDYFIVNGSKFPFQKETLKSLGIPQEKLIVSHSNLHIKADRLVIPSLPRARFNTTTWTPKWVCDFLKEKFISDGKSDTLDTKEKLYISRANARFRRVINETEVIDFLTQFGFKVVSLELIPVSEQARLFFSANTIVAPHGAGLANLAFCQPKTKVIEFFSPNYLNLCHWVISNQIGLEYYYLMSDGENSNSTSTTYIPQPNEDIIIELKALESIIKAV
jgi:hypothetical protein